MADDYYTNIEIFTKAFEANLTHTEEALASFYRMIQPIRWEYWNKSKWNCSTATTTRYVIVGSLSESEPAVHVVYLDGHRTVFMINDIQILLKDSPAYQVLLDRFVKEVYAIVEQLGTESKSYMELLIGYSLIGRELTALQKRPQADRTTIRECTCGMWVLLHNVKAITRNDLYRDGHKTAQMIELEAKVKTCPCCTWFIACFGLVEEAKDDYQRFAFGLYFDHRFAEYLHLMSYITPVDLAVMMEDERLRDFAATIHQTPDITFRRFNRQLAKKMTKL
jgi:hypothetical protein